MTAEVSALFPTGDQADETVRRTIDALIKGRDLTVEQAADMAHINRATLYRRLAGEGSRQAFKAGEVAALARVLRVKIGEIYGGLGGVFVPPPPTPGAPEPTQSHAGDGNTAGLHVVGSTPGDHSPDLEVDAA